MHHRRRPAQVWRVWPAVLCGSIAASACGFFEQGQSTVQTDDHPQSESSGAAGSAGAPPSGGGGAGGDSGGGGGQAPECLSPVECQGITNECTERTCEGGAC